MLISLVSSKRTSEKFFDASAGCRPAPPSYLFIKFFCFSNPKGPLSMRVKPFVGATLTVGVRTSISVA